MLGSGWELLWGWESVLDSGSPLVYQLGSVYWREELRCELMWVFGLGKVWVLVRVCWWGVGLVLALQRASLSALSSWWGTG